MGQNAEIVSTLHLSVNNDFIYLTLDDEKPQSSSFILNIRRRDVPVSPNGRALSPKAAGVQSFVLARENSTASADGRPCILLGCDWKNDLESICREGEQKNIRITQEYGETGNRWEVSWEEQEELLAGVCGCWKLKPSADAELDQEFSVSFLFEVGVTRALQGGAVFYVMGRNLPDFPENQIFIFTIYKIYPISMKFLKKPPACLEEGEEAEFSWEIRNAQYCTLNYVGCNPQDTMKETFRQSKTYMLTAQNQKGRMEFLTAEVKKTNWKYMGEISGCPLGRETYYFNYKILEYRETFYLYYAGAVYKSGNGRSWEVVSRCSIREEELPKAYTTVLWKDRIYVLGDARGQNPEENKVCYYSISQNEWKQEPLVTTVETGCCAVVFLGEPYYCNLITGNRIVVYHYADAYWNPEVILSLDEFSFALEEAEAVDGAWCQDCLYLAVKDKKTRAVYLISSRNGCDWKEERRLEIQAPGWYRLISTGGNLLLATGDRVLSLIDTQKWFENYLPQVSADWSQKPWCGYAQGVLWLIAQEEEQAALWRFRESNTLQ